MNFAPGKIPLQGKNPVKCIFSAPAQEMAKHHAKFGWRKLTDVSAVSYKANMWNWLKFAGVLQNPELISAATGLKFTA